MKIILSSIAATLVVRTISAIAIYSESLRFIYFDKSYHLYYGIVLAIAGFALKKYKQVSWSTIVIVVGLALIVDDIMVVKYILQGVPADPIGDYWSPLFVLPMLAGLLLISIYEKKRI